MSLEKFCYMKRIVQFSVLVCFFIGFNLSCSTSEQDGAAGKLPVPDYAQSEMWYRSLEGAANKAVDVFYITPKIGSCRQILSTGSRRKTPFATRWWIES